MQVECHSQLGTEEEGGSYLGNDYLKKKRCMGNTSCRGCKNENPNACLVWRGGTLSAYRGITKKILGPIEICKHEGLGCGVICVTGSSLIAMQ